MEGKTDDWRAELYCENQACDIREITPRVKERDDDPPHIRGPFRCPNCADGLKFHWIRNSEEWEAAKTGRRIIDQGLLPRWISRRRVESAPLALTSIRL
jgi:hypothetical protein